MELRKDYFLDRWVVIANGRQDRPKQIKKEKPSPGAVDFFAPGNEKLTPPEIGRIPQGKGWKMRWFPNKFPAAEPHGNWAVQTHNDFFTFADAYGYHEVIAETNDDRQLWDLPKEDHVTLLKLYRDRIQDIQKREHISYVSVFKNHGLEAGASLLHSHSQLVGVSLVPGLIHEKANHCENGCKYCRVLNIEKGSYRRCFENSTFVAFTPYASRFNLELWILPKGHKRGLHELSEEEFSELADILKKALGRLKTLNTPYNFYLQHAPPNRDFHFHIELTPRLIKWAGFEYSTGFYINPLSPEDAAKFYRGE